MPVKSHASLGAGLVVLSSFFYASYGIWTKLMGDFFTGYTATVIRSVLVVTILLLIAISARKLEPLNLKANWPYILGMTLAAVLTWGPLYYAILNGGVGISLSVNYAGIVIGSFFFGWLWAREVFTRTKAFSALLGIVGLVLVFSPTLADLTTLPLLAALTSGICTAVGIVLSKQIKYASAQSTLVWWTSGLVANALVVALLDQNYPAFHWQVEWLYLLCFALASVVASWSLVRGVKLISAGTAGILGLLEIVFGMFFGVFLFHERPGVVALAGVVLILFSAAAPYFRDPNSVDI
jgi:drug/metabolite transporter (DMT)-like permease